MIGLADKTIQGIPIIQNKQDFVLAKFSIAQIQKFTRYTKRLIVNYDENEEPIYNDQIQRSIEDGRVERIADYLTKDPEASFPTNIVLHIPKQAIKKQKLTEDGFVLIELKEKVFEEVKKEKGNIYITIIDGQHRIRGIERAIERLRNDIDNLVKTLNDKSNPELEARLKFSRERLNDLNKIELVVSFFIDETLEYQAMIFSTINRTQKRVSPDLVFSLFGLDSKSTPQRTALQVVLILNGHHKSPFYKRIKLYGGEYDNSESRPLSQATMVRSIVALISENLRESENDRYKKRQDLLHRSIGSKKVLPFRKYYASDEDEVISDIMFHYFSSVRDVFKDSNGKSYWEFPLESNSPENIFHTTVGYEILLKILVEILEENPTGDYTTSFFKKYLIKCEGLDIADYSRYSFNNRGKRILYLDINLKLWPHVKTDEKDKRPQELADILRETIPFNS
jgi:DGQHR domain-containing protein